jgi:hypothetical protein
VWKQVYCLFVLGISDLEMVVEAVEAKFDSLDLEWGWSGFGVDVYHLSPFF